MKTIFSTLAGLLIYLVTCNGQLYPSQNKDHTLLVKGTAIMKQIPELIYVSINVKSESYDYSECQNSVLAKMGKVKSAILKQKISKDLIKTNEITIAERKEFNNGKTVNTGFIGNVSMIIESPYSIDISNKLLSAFKSDSLILNYTVGFRLSEAQKSKLRQDAITLAIEDAKEKAALLAKSSDIKLLSINSISYLDDDFNYLRDRDIIKEVVRPAQDEILYIRGTESNTPNIDFNPKEIGIIKSVRIEWKIEE